MNLDLVQALVTTTGPLGLFAYVVWRTMSDHGKAHTEALTSLERRMDALNERLAVLIDRQERGAA